MTSALFPTASDENSRITNSCPLNDVYPLPDKAACNVLVRSATSSLLNCTTPHSAPGIGNRPHAEERMTGRQHNSASSAVIAKTSLLDGMTTTLASTNA